MENNLSDVDKEIYSCLSLKEPKSFFLFAGAGSGKTGTLVRVLQKFRDENIQQLRLSGQKTAIITYTNAARDEIKRRLDFDSSFIVSTIHAFCWDLIRPFQEDIREWLLINLQDEVAKLKLAQSKGRPSKASIGRENKIALKSKRLKNLNQIRSFAYNPSGSNNSRDSLNHAQVIKIASEFLDSKKLMQKILVRKYPILLVDESQDTKKSLIEALLKLQPIFSLEFSLGLFGDTMQRIYTDGKKDLGDILPPGWLRPEKTINYRCPERVITLINKIRENQPQVPGGKNEEGIVRLFIVDSSKAFNKIGIEESIANQMGEFSDDHNWRNLDEVKILTLEHKMAAKRGGFLEFFQPLYDMNKGDTGGGKSGVPTGLLDGTMQGISFLIKKLLPLVEAILANDDFKVADLVKSNSSLLDKVKLSKSLEPLVEFQNAKKAVDELQLMWSMEADPLLIDIVKKVYDLGIFNVPDVLLPIVQRSGEYTNALDTEGEASDSGDSLKLSVIHLDDSLARDLGLSPSSEDEGDPEINAWDDALQAPFSQLVSYNEYISDNSRFGTHQGVKGLEFPRVMVILDDEEAGGNQFSYEKLFGAKKLSDIDEKNIKEKKDSTLDRTRRLFYVTCSRAEKSLAIVAYTENPIAVKSYAISQEWFSEDEVIDVRQQHQSKFFVQTPKRLN